MTFQLGQPGGPGRPPGRNKVREILEKMHVDPIMELIAIAAKPMTTDRMRVDIYQNLLNYIHPRLKQVSVTDIDGNNLMPSIIRVVTAKDDSE